MSELAGGKVGIVACSGEELPEGTVSRLAALEVLGLRRPRETVTICLPLFLAGGAADRNFARIHPTITVDGCELRCAARATEMHSGKPAACLVVTEIAKELGLEKPKGSRRLDEAGRQAVRATAERLAALVDEILAKSGQTAVAEEAADPTTQEKSEVTCSCGSGVPVGRLVIDGKAVELVALPLIFQKFRAAGGKLAETQAREMFEMVKVYNSVPSESEESYRQAVLREYAAWCRKETER